VRCSLEGKQRYAVENEGALDFVGSELVGRTPRPIWRQHKLFSNVLKDELQRRLKSLLPIPETISSKDNLVSGTVVGGRLVATT
jgi:hypothetical protein